jgi:hypothetical protein
MGKPSHLLVAIAASPAISQPCAWEHVLTPAVPDARAEPAALDVADAGNAWMVGTLTVGALPFWSYHNYAARFDGQSWITTPVPSVDALGDHNSLNGVVAIAPDEAYAGGSTKWMGSNQVQIFRWNGDDWSLEALNVIDDVGSVSGMGQAGDAVWAVGSRSSQFDPPQTSGIALSLRRENGSWVEEFVPPLAAFGRSVNTLRALDGVAPDDAWAVGSARQVYTPGPSFAFSRYLVHWDGDEWSLDQTLPFLERSTFEDIEMTAADDGWAVGYKALPGTNQPMIVRFDGQGWTETELDPLPGTGGVLRGLAAVAPDEVYALGVYDDNGQNRLLVYRFDGVAWTRTDAAPTGGSGEQFMAADAGSDGTVWGVGIYVRPGSGPLAQRLVCHHACPADLAEPAGALNFFDVAAYLAIYSAGDPAADLAEPSGVLNFFDISAYLAAFSAGCP